MAVRELKATDGFTFNAYQARPTGDIKAGVVVIQEIFGVNRHIRAVCDSYAGAGYLAIAPQIFDRVERDVELGYTDQTEFDKGIRLAFKDLAIADALKDIQAAVDAAAEYGKVGVVGYCFGGLLTWLAACELRNVAAAAAYYGGGIASEAQRRARCPVMMHFGERDQHIPMSAVEAIRAAQPDVQVFAYDADHGFNCDERGSFDQTSAAIARERTLAFFDKQLEFDADATMIMTP